MTVEVTPRATSQTDLGQIGVRIGDHPLRTEQIRYGFRKRCTAVRRERPRRLA